MAQHDQVIDNGPGLAVRTDINAALAALFTSSSGTTEPTVKSQGQFWLDTSVNPAQLKIRNVANNGWFTVMNFNNADIGFGKRTGPNRFVWNDKADMSGNDIMSLDMSTGALSAGGTLALRDGAAALQTRGNVIAGVGSDTPGLTLEAFDGGGSLANRAWLDATGFRFRYGDLLFLNSSTSVLRGAFRSVHGSETANSLVEAYDNSGVISAFLQATVGSCGAYSGNGVFRYGGNDGVWRGLLNCDPAASNANSWAELRAVDKTNTTIGNIIVDAPGFRTGSGDYYVMNSSVIRAKFGWDSSFSAFVKTYDAAGANANVFAMTGTGFTIWSPQGSQALYRAINNANGNVRGSIGFNSDTSAAALAYITANDNSGTRTQRMEIDAAGARLLDGSVAGDIMTTGNFPAKNTGAAATDLVVGSFVFYNATATTTRNASITVRLDDTRDFIYKVGGTGTTLSGTWRNCGIWQSGSDYFGVARRVS